MGRTEQPYSEIKLAWSLVVIVAEAKATNGLFQRTQREGIHGQDDVLDPFAAETQDG